MQSACRKPQSAENTAGSWRVIRPVHSRRHRAKYRKWRRIYARSGTAMVLFVPLFLLVWFVICTLSPRNHLFWGILLLLILAAEAACVIVHLISDMILQRAGITAS